MEDELMGMVQRFVADRVPRGWHACDGARLSVRGNEALYSLVGTIYGGDAHEWFNLPLGGPALPDTESPELPAWFICIQGLYPVRPVDERTPERNMTDEYVGAIKAFAGTYAPAGYMWCEGQELKITQNQMLFAVLMNRFGGDGRMTFRLPDMRAHDAAGKPIPFAPTSWGSPAPPGPHRPGWVICVDGLFTVRD